MIHPFSPPIGFAIYLAATALLLVVAGAVSARGQASAMKTSIYGSGEAAQRGAASPGYRPFFMTAFFFAMLHLGVLMLGTGTPSPILVIYVGGLMLALLALILG